MTQKELDYVMSVRLENLVSNLSRNADIRGKMDEVEYQNAVVALRYAVAVLRSREVNGI